MNSLCGGDRYRREQWCHTALDIDPQRPDDDLERLASSRLLREVRYKNRAYFQAAVLACAMAMLNLVVSVVYLSLNFGGIMTITALLSFCLLAFGQLAQSVALAFSGYQGHRGTFVMRSAFIVDHAVFNAIDKVQQPHLHETPADAVGAVRVRGNPFSHKV